MSYLWLAIMLVWAASAWAFTTTTCVNGEVGTCRLTNGTAADLTNAIAASANGDGTKYQDGIYIPASTFTVDMVLAGKNGLHITGAGTSSTHITCSFRCVQMTGTVNHARVTNIHFIGGGGSAFLYGLGTGTNNRFDHNTMTGTIRFGYLADETSNVVALVDHNTHNYSGLDSNTGVGFFINGPGMAPWQTPIDLTSWSDWWVFEDNTWVTHSANDYFETHIGAKVLFRHNTITEGSIALTSMFDQHNSKVPQAGNNGVGGRAYIIHDNFLTYTQPNNNNTRLMYFRAGTGLVYNNIIDITANPGGGFGVQFNYFRASSQCGSSYIPSTTDNVSEPSVCSGCMAACVDPNYTSGSLRGEGLPGYEQPGASLHTAVREPWYFWNNKFRNSGVDTLWTATTPSLNDSTTSTALQNGREWCSSLTTQPTSCGGVALTYVEVAYPHPLIGGIDTTPPAAPTGVRIQ